MTVHPSGPRLVVKHRYSYADVLEGTRVNTRHRMTAEAAAASEMVDAVPIAGSREERYVAENPNLMP
jgi:hypothetical protein